MSRLIHPGGYDTLKDRFRAPERGFSGRGGDRTVRSFYNYGARSVCLYGKLVTPTAVWRRGDSITLMIVFLARPAVGLTWGR